MGGLNYPPLEVCGLSVHRAGRTCLSGVSFTVQPRQVIGLVGPNGSGKTTLLLALAGAVPLRGGQILFGGVEVHRLMARDRARVFALLEQSPTVAWSMTVRELVALGRLPLVARGEHGSSYHARAIEDAVARLELAELAERDVTCLSIGERVRAHLARVVVQDTPWVLLDEPFASLDAKHRGLGRRLLRDLSLEGRGVLVSLHDLAAARTLCDRVLVLSQGQLAAVGEADTVLCRDLLASVFGLSPEESQLLEP
jgi:iron complex transport system ATP-binding protein